MKQLKLAVMALFTLALVSNVNAQDENNPWVIGFGVNALDNRVYSKSLGDAFEDLVGLEELSDNFLPSISRITVDRYLTKGFSLQLAGSINKVTTKIVENDADALYWATNFLVKYDLNNLYGYPDSWFDPFVGIGGGLQSYDGTMDGVFYSMVGVNTWFNENLGLNFQTGHTYGFGPTGRDFFQWSAGLVIRFGGKDTDNDGIYDKEDACPTVPGLVEFNGCPDADSDGVKDSDDACPNVAGLAAMNGCPDSDGDGVADKDDMCPNSKGTKANKGCPDTDGDGVLDKDDKCATVAGPAANSGCPWPDTDGDGVLDKDDKCINVVGPASNNGCPEPTITKEEADVISFTAKSILFNTGKSSFKKGVVSKLDAIAAVMNKYNRANFAIGGHTDSQGRASTNLKLSEKRAIAVKDYLVSKGVDATRLEAAGFGEEFSVDTNKTRAGRANNRRVEIKVTN